MKFGIIMSAILLAMIVALYLVNKSRERQKERADEAEARAKTERAELAKREKFNAQMETIENERQAKTGKVTTGRALTDFDNSLDVLSDIAGTKSRVSK